MIERHQDYQLTIPTVPVGGLQEVPLTLDTDAPFLLRLVKSRNIGLNGWRFQTPRKAFQSSDLRTDWNIPYSAFQTPQPGRGSIVYPELVYPIGSQIVVDIGNATDEPITNARLLFRGSKLYRDGVINAPTYPAKMSVLPGCYPVIVTKVGLATDAAHPFIQRDIPLNILQDADFVYRYGVADPFTLGVEGGIVPPPGGGPFFTPATFQEIYVQIKDESRKAYSNEPIHINDLFGQGSPFLQVTGVGGGDDPGVGPMFPGLVTPEIYLERQHALYLDIFRYDTAGVSLDLHFRFQGMKVFPRS